MSEVDDIMTLVREYHSDNLTYIGRQKVKEKLLKKDKEIERLNNIMVKAVDKIQYIIDYGFDYDGFNNVDDLKGLIDMLVQYAVESRNILKGEDKE